MTYFVIICITKKFQVNMEVLEVLITHVTNRGKAGVILHTGADSLWKKANVLREKRGPGNFRHTDQNWITK